MILVGQMILLVDGDGEQYITFRSMGKEAYLRLIPLSQVSPHLAFEERHV